MSTKAEVTASIDAINNAAKTAASVAAALTDGSTRQDIAFLKTPDGQIVVYSETGVTDIKWVGIVNDGKTWAWYGNLSPVLKLPTVINPALRQPTDFIKVFYGLNFQKAVDSPKSAPPTVPTTPTVPAQPVSAVGPFAFVRNMVFNANVERLRPLTMKYQGTPLTQPPYYKYLASKGITGVRNFIPYRADRDMGLGTGVPAVSQYDGLLDAAQSANMAGLPVLLGITDVVGEGVINFDDWNTHAANVANRVKERGFAPSMLALEVANELAGNDNVFWNQMRCSIHDTIRKILPNHTIVHGCCGWNGVSGWDDKWQVPSDTNIILQFHSYANFTEDQWKWLNDNLGAFAKRLNVPMIGGETNDGFDKGDPSNRQSWIDNWKRMAKVAGALRPCPWTITDMDGFRMNRTTSDPTLYPEIEAALPEIITLAKAAPGWSV